MLAVLLPLLALSGCNRTPTPSPSTTDGLVTAEEGAPPADPTRLSLAVVPRARDGGIPSEIAINFSLPVFPRSAVDGPPPEGTVVKVEPAVEGELRVTDRATLLFRPTGPLRPGTTYTVRVEAVGGSEGAAWLPNWAPVEAPVVTPAFELLHTGLRKWDRATTTAELTLVFAAPVDPAAVAERLTVALGKTRLAPLSVASGDAPEAVRVVLRDARLLDAVRPGTEGTPLDVTLAAGVPMLGLDDVTAPAGAAQVSLVFDAPPVKVLAVKLREGRTGFYVDVICDDGAVDEKRWWWDREDWNDYQVSARCELDAESARSTVHLSPDAPFSVGPADGGFRIFADLPFGSTTVRIDAGARTVDGGAVMVGREETLEVPHRSPRLDFASPGRYLPRAAWNSLAVTHTNVAAVDVTIRHVPAENLVFWMEGEERASERTSDVVAKKRVVLDNPVDREATSWLDVGGMVPDASTGLYEIALEEVSADELDGKKAAEPEGPPDTGGGGEEPRRWHASARAAARIVLTDLHLLAKIAEPTPEAPWSPEVKVWTVAVDDNQPVSGTEVSLVRASGKVVGRCVTDGEGTCTVAVPKDGLDAAPPVALLARRGGDLTYLRFADLEDRAEGDVTGTSYRTEAPWRAAVWSDRGVYRPGDVAHVAALLRTEGHTAPTESVPALVKLFDPQAKELRRVVATTNEAGMLSADLRFSDYATTGRYRVAIDIGGVEAGTAAFNVEEFVPERLRVGLTPAADRWLVTDEKSLSLGAEWLFGGPVKGADATLECRLEPGTFAPKGFGTYRFGPLATGDDDAAPPAIPLGSTSVQLDEEGHASVTCPASPGATALRGPATLVARASVFEGDSGRTTVQEAKVPVHPDTAYAGLAGTDRGEAGVALTVNGVVVGVDGAAKKGTTKVPLTFYELQEEMGWVYDRASGSSRYRRTLHRVQLDATVATATDGSFTAKFTPKASAAAWLVVADLGRARTELRIQGDGGRWWWSSLDEDVDRTPRPGRPTNLRVTAPERSRVGDRVNVTLVAPYPGRILWTVETDHVVRSSWSTATAGENTWSFPVEAFQPDYYVSALLLKDPHLESPEAFFPDRAFGVARVRVEPTAYTVPLTLGVPAEVRPNGKLDVTLDAGPLTEPTFVTVAAVDEGILSLTRFADPDPALAIFAPRALGVRSFETVGWTLLHEPAGAGRRTGGDAAGGLGRVQMVKPVALWSGIVALGKDGKGKVSFDVPSYRGSLRVMAVAAGRVKMGHAAASVPVREPLTLTTTVPRFLLRGDRAQVPVQVANLTGGAVTATVRMTVSDAARPADVAFVDIAGRPASVTFGGAQVGTIGLPKGGSGTVVFQLAANSLGAAKIEVVASAGKHESRETYEVPVLSPYAEVRLSEQFALGKGTTDLGAALSGWEAGSDRTTVWLTRNPYARSLTHLRALLHYPYGCIEQTTSSTRPLLYARTLLGSAAPDIAAAKKVDDMVQAGLDRVSSMQTPSGGFAYWPGGSQPDLWGTAYGAHLMVDAKAAGFPVPETVMGNALGWLERQLDRTYGVELGEIAYAHYVLARAGRPHAAQARRALEKIDEVSFVGWREEARTLLQAAIQLSGDRRYEGELRAMKPNALAWNRYEGHTYWSDLRTEGMRLAVYRDLFGAGGAGDALATSVAGALSEKNRASSWYTTQELAWGITGLGKSVPTQAAAIATPTLLVGGKKVEPAGRPAGDQGDWTFTVSRAAGSTMTVAVPDGAGVFAVVTTEGHRLDTATTYGGQGLALSRVYRDNKGRAIDPTDIELGQAVFVDLTLSNRAGRDLDHLALVDRIPGGWEIENPRLGRGGMPEGVDLDALWDVEHMNLRDDRLEVFGRLGAGESRHVVYQVRAVTAGAWTLPEASAEAMYDPSVWARLAGEPVKVVGQWAGFLL